MNNKYKSLSDYIDKNKRKIAKIYYKEIFGNPYINNKDILSWHDKINILINNYYAYNDIPNSVCQYINLYKIDIHSNEIFKNKLIKILKINDIKDCNKVMWFIKKQIAIIENHYTTQGITFKHYWGDQNEDIRQLNDFYAYLEKGILKKELEINLSSKTVTDKKVSKI